MKTAVGTMISEPLGRAIGYVADLARRHAQQADQAQSFLRLETRLPAIDPLAWLAAQEGEDLMYWRDRDGQAEYAVCGHADLITVGPETTGAGFGTLLNDHIARARPELRYFGGFCFDPARPLSRDWQPFGKLRLILPRWELSRHGGESVLACHVGPNDAEYWRHAHNRSARLAELRALDHSPAPALQVSLEHSPDREQWDLLLDKVLAILHSQPLSKLVLDRQSRLGITERINPWSVLARLRETAGNSYLFGISPVPGYCFLGASPERLYKRRTRHLATEAVAGTRPRGDSPAEDAAREKELLQSEKEQLEHELVTRHIGEVLSRLCEQVTCDPTPRVLRLRHVMHRVTPFDSRLKEKVADADILASLHPTPAVAGYPVAEAIKQLRIVSPVNRGWYAGPVGWTSTNAAEFAVAIRSALLTPQQAKFYAGAGIVSGSTAQPEWHELDSKLESLLEAFLA